LGAVKGSAFDQGINLAILLDTATMAAVVCLQNGSITARNSVQYKRPSQIRVQLERVQVGMSQRRTPVAIKTRGGGLIGLFTHLKIHGTVGTACKFYNMRILYSLIIFFDRHSYGFISHYPISFSFSPANISVDTGTLLYGTLQFNTGLESPSHGHGPRVRTSSRMLAHIYLIYFSRCFKLADADGTRRQSDLLK
jgi:hypothetical protein